MELGDRIRLRREELGLSQDELAQKLGYKSRSSINKIEKGQNDIPQSKVSEFAIALDTTAEYLLGLDVNGNKQADIPQVRAIQRAMTNVSEADRERMLQILKLSFKDAFDGKDD